MSNHRMFRLGWKGVSCFGLLLIGLWLGQSWLGVTNVQGAEDGAATQVAQAWANVRNSTHYNFSADVTMTTIPLPTAGNIGRFSKTDSLYLEGTNNLVDETMQMALWGGGVSVADQANAYQMRVQDGATQMRVGNGEWQANKGDTLSFAPEGDFLAFLDIAKNVAFASEQPTNTEGQNMVIYTFDLDGRAYAEKLTRITQKQLVSDGQLPPGASIQIPNHLAKLTGSGELWIDARGLPVRQKIAMSMPPTPGSDNRTETVMDIYFSDYQLDPPLLAAVPLLQPLARSLTSIALPTPYEAGTTFALFSLTLVGMAILIRPSRRTQLSVTVVTLFAIILTPTLQAQASSLAIDRLTAYQTRAAVSERPVEIAQKDVANQKGASEAVPYAPPEAALNLPAAAPAAR